MNLATARNLTLDEAVRALDTAWYCPLTEDVQESIIAKLVENSDALIDAKSQIKTLNTRLASAYYALRKVNEQLEHARAALAFFEWCYAEGGKPLPPASHAPAHYRSSTMY